MAKNVKVELNLKGLNELMKSPEMASCLQEAGERVARAAGEGYEAKTYTDTKYIAICDVSAVTDKAKKENYEKNTLLKALGSSGLPLTK